MRKWIGLEMWLSNAFPLNPFSTETVLVDFILEAGV